MESIIIISVIILSILAGVYCVYYLGQYLYELYVEYFTTDINPDHSIEFAKAIDEVTKEI